MLALRQGSAMIYVEAVALDTLPSDKARQVVENCIVHQWRTGETARKAEAIRQRLAEETT